MEMKDYVSKIISSNEIKKIYETNSDGIKIKLNDAEEMVISGDTSDLLNFANSLINVALAESLGSHIHHDETTLLSADSEIKNIVVVNEQLMK